MFAGPELLLLPLLGHLVAAEHGAIRRALLFVFAKYIEIPLLWIAYHASIGHFRFISDWPPTRRVLGRLLGYPVARWVDTGSPAPLAEILTMIDQQAEAIAVGPCRCRTAHGRCSHRIETDIVIRTGTGAWLRAFPDQYRIIDKEEAKAIVRECAAEQMFHMVFVHCRLGSAMNEYVLCNCCRDGCSVYLANIHLGQKCFPLIPGNHFAVVDPSRCRACGACVDVCPWGARTVEDGVPGVDLSRCFGCGLCVSACDRGANRMERKPGRLPFRTAGEHPDPDWPADAPATGFWPDR